MIAFAAVLVAFAAMVFGYAIGLVEGHAKGWHEGRREEREAARIREDLEMWPGPR